MGLPLHAQQEADLDDGGARGGVSVIGLHRSWLPDERYRANTGLFVETIAFNDESSVAGSFMLLATGMGDRNVLALIGGVNLTIVGNRKLGLFVAGNLGVTFGSNTGLLAFDVITDPTLSVGLAGLMRVGLRVPITADVHLHASVLQSWFSNERGAAPPGVQVGFTLGGGQ